jgi:hypothetical protein
VERFKREHTGVANRFKTLFLASGVDATVVGSNLEQMDFTKTQGAGEVRIAAAAMVPAAIAGLSEGLAGSSLNAGNLSETWRQFANGWARPAWRDLCGSLQRIVNVPVGSELVIDDREIPALQEDAKKAAETRREEAATIQSLIQAGFTPVSVVDAVTSGDLTRLEHSGLVSVQLLPPGSDPNGNGNAQGAHALA